MIWTQNYDPFASPVLPPLAAAVPVLLLLGLLASGRVPAPAAALAGLSAALMVGAGFWPLDAAVLSLLANTAPVAFGALGTPITTLSSVTRLDVHDLSAMAGRQLPFFSLLVPAWLVWAMAGWRGVVGVWPAVLVAGGSFAVAQFAVANLHGPWLVDVVAGIISLVSLALLLCIWQPAVKWRYT